MTQCWQSGVWWLGAGAFGTTATPREVQRTASPALDVIAAALSPAVNEKVRA